VRPLTLSVGIWPGATLITPGRSGVTLVMTVSLANDAEILALVGGVVSNLLQCFVPAGVEVQENTFR
jgi:hypothetical protein